MYEECQIPEKGSEDLRTSEYRLQREYLRRGVETNHQTGNLHGFAARLGIGERS
jgi:hypothetical protein